MLYVRGNPLDYNTWSQLGNRGWSYDSVLPYFRKSEHFEGTKNPDETRGRNGPLNVANMCENHEICDAFIEAGVREGWPRNPDYNNGHQEGFGYYQVTQKRGRRWSTARAFLRPALARPNLHVETAAHATGIILDGKRAVGIRYWKNGQSHEARCTGEVILAAGAVQSPHLLELSGIGQPDRLQSLGIPVSHELPGVGENYRDHFAPRMNWRVKLPITLNEQTRGLYFAREVAKYAVLRRGILTFTAGIAYGFIRTRPELEEPDIQYHFAHASYATAATRILDSQPGMTITTYQCRPESKGSIHAKSPDPMAHPAIRPNFLADELDQRTVVAGMKIARRIINNPAMDRYRGNELNPGDKVQTDDEWLEFARINGQTTYHVCRHLQDGQRPDGGRGRSASRPRHRRPARHRRLDLPDDDLWQYQRRGHHGCGKRCGLAEAGLTRRSACPRCLVVRYHHAVGPPGHQAVLDLGRLVQLVNQMQPDNQQQQSHGNSRQARRLAILVTLPFLVLAPRHRTQSTLATPHAQSVFQ